jgi:hypothetical protein
VIAVAEDFAVNLSGFRTDARARPAEILGFVILAATNARNFAVDLLYFQQTEFYSSTVGGAAS